MRGTVVDNVWYRVTFMFPAPVLMVMGAVQTLTMETMSGIPKLEG